jgi:hypothetical protein
MIQIAEITIGCLKLRREEPKSILKYSENSRHRRLDSQELLGSEDLFQTLLIAPSRKGEVICVSNDGEMRRRRGEHQPSDWSLPFVLDFQPVSQQLPERRQPVQTVSRSPTQKDSQAPAEVANEFQRAPLRHPLPCR